MTSGLVELRRLGPMMMEMGRQSIERWLMVDIVAWGLVLLILMFLKGGSRGR